MLPTISLRKFVFLALAFFCFESIYCLINISGSYISVNGGAVKIQSDTLKKICYLNISGGWTVFINGENITTNNQGNYPTIKVESSGMKPFLFGLFCGTVASFAVINAIAASNQKKNPTTRQHVTNNQHVQQNQNSTEKLQKIPSTEKNS